MFINTEAANRSRRLQTISSSGNAVPYTPSQDPLLEEPLHSRDAPPSYLEATTPGLYSGRLSGDEGATLLNRGSQVYKEDTDSGRSFRQSLRTSWTKWLGVLMLIVFVTAAGVAFTTSANKTRQTSVTPVTQPSAQAAATGPSMIPASTQAARPNELEAISPKQIFPIRWPARCGKKYNVKTEDYDFSSTSRVSIKEAVHQLDGPYKRIQGWVHITKAPAHQAAGTLQARLSYAVSPSVDVDSIKYTSTSRGLTIGGPSIPTGLEGVPAGSACLGMSIVLYVAPGATLEMLSIEATHLGMQIHAGAEFSVTNTTAISLTSGTLDSAMLNSRRIYLKTTSGSISGKYALADTLEVETKTGSVNMGVKPLQAAAAEQGVQAIFRAKSHSGSMRIDFERKRIPERDYQMYLDTNVGSIDGTFIHGSKTEIKSVAGSVTADILPFKSGAYASTLNTSTHSGQMNVTLRAPYGAKSVPLTGLMSTHKSVSGGVGLVYPKEWQGHVDGTSLSGSLHLQGTELELLKENNTPGMNHVEAKKGNGASTMVFNTISGGCNIVIGKT